MILRRSKFADNELLIVMNFLLTDYIIRQQVRILLKKLRN